MKYFYLQMINEKGISYSSIIQCEKTDITRKMVDFLFQYNVLKNLGHIEVSGEFSGDYRIEAKTVPDFKTKESKTIAKMNGNEIEMTEAHRFRRLKEVIRDKGILNSEKLSILESEGYKPNEIIESCLEEK